MESLTYNGIKLEVIRTGIVTRTTEYADDGVTRLWEKWVIDIRAIYNPGATSYATIGGQPVPVGGDGELPGTTDNAIRHNLSMPRKLLTMVAGGRTILESPGKSDGGQRLDCDAKGGPFPVVNSINSMIGTVFWEVGIQITTYVNECGNVDLVSNAVLSHSWASAETIDKLFYPTIVTYGEAVLRMDAMLWNQITADHFRKQFFFPIPDNYQRESIEVKLSPDGSRLTYSFKDVGKCYNLGKGSPVVYAEISQQGSISHGSEGRAFLQAVPHLALGAASITAGALQVSGAGAGAFHSAREVVRIIANNLPQYWFELDVQLWGDRNARRSELTRIALGVASGQLAVGAASVSDVASTEIFIQHDRATNQYVRVRFTQKWGDDLRIPAAIGPQLQAQIPNFGNAISGGKAFWLSLFTDPTQDREIRGNGAVFLSQDIKDNPAPTEGAYGRLIVGMVQQALTDPCSPPLLPNGTPIPPALQRNESVIR